MKFLRLHVHQFHFISYDMIIGLTHETVMGFIVIWRNTYTIQGIQQLPKSKWSCFFHPPVFNLRTILYSCIPLVKWWMVFCSSTFNNQHTSDSNHAMHKSSSEFDDLTHQLLHKCSPIKTFLEIFFDTYPILTNIMTIIFWSPWAWLIPQGSMLLRKWCIVS